MKRFSKFICPILVVVVLFAALAGCTSGGNKPNADEGQKGSTSQNETQPSSKEPVIVTIWGGVPAETGPGALVEAFNKSRDDIQIEYYRYVNDDQGNLKLDTALMAGEKIDAYFSYWDELIVKRVDAGLAVDLAPYMERDGFNMVENYGEAFFKYKDTVYAIPTAEELIFIYCNKDMFDEAGIPVPTDWTMEEYREITKKLTKNGVFGGGANEWANVWKNIFHTQLIGANSFYKEDGTSNFDHPAFKEALLYMKDLMINDKSHMSLIEVQNSKLTPYGEFLNGKTATVAVSAWIIRNIKNTEQFPHDFVTALAPFPTLEKGKPDYGWAGLNNYIMMNSGSKNKDAAWEAIKYWGTEGQLYMCLAGKVPSWKKINRDEALRIMLGDKANELFDAESVKKTIFEHNSKLFVNTETTAYPEIVEIWREEVEKVIGANKDIDTALADAKRRADEAIAKAKAQN
jgi:multiple sugar transport system substrate-binding protein